MTPRREETQNDVDEAVARILDRVELVDPPADLKQNVLRAIGTRPEPARAGWFESLRAGLSRRFFAPLVPFAAGAVAATLVFAIASGGRLAVGTGPLDGAMAPYLGAGSQPAGTKVDDQRFELGRANVRFEVFRSGDRAALSVTTDAAEPVVITAQLAPGSARMERIIALPAAPGGLEYGEGWVRVRQSGQDRAEIALTISSGAGDAPIRISIASSAGSIQGVLHAAASAAPVQAPAAGGR